MNEMCKYDADGRCIHPAPWDQFDGRREYRRDEGWICRSCWRVAVTEEQAEVVNMTLGPGETYRFSKPRFIGEMPQRGTIHFKIKKDP